MVGRVARGPSGTSASTWTFRFFRRRSAGRIEYSVGGDYMEYSRMGSAGIDISTVTLGAWAFGSNEWGNQGTDEECARVIAAALDHGINILDTAPGYQRSQEIVGKALKALGGRRKELYIATKCTGERENIRRQCDESLRLLGV